MWRLALQGDFQALGNQWMASFKSTEENSFAAKTACDGYANSPFADLPLSGSSRFSGSTRLENLTSCYALSREHFLRERFGEVRVERRDASRKRKTSGTAARCATSAKPSAARPELDEGSLVISICLS